MPLREYRKKLEGALGTLLRQGSTPMINQGHKIDAVETRAPNVSVYNMTPIAQVIEPLARYEEVPGPTLGRIRFLDNDNSASYTLPQVGEHVSNSLTDLLNYFPIGTASDVTGVNTGHQAKPSKYDESQENYIKKEWEESFVPAGRKVPAEILVQIFDWQRDDRSPPTRSLALVCTHWRELILNSPLLWNNLYANFCEEDKVIAAAIQTRRRIELSRSAPLNITLSTTNYTTKCMRQDVLDLVASTGVERWKTLELEHKYQAPPVQIFGFNTIFASGQFSSLRVLRISYNTLGDPFVAIGQLIVQSKPAIEEIYAPGDLPDIYHDPKLFQHCRIVSGQRCYLQKLPGITALQDLRVIGLLSFDDALPFPLPERVTFDSLFNYQLGDSQFTNIRHLEVKSWRQSTPTTINCPNLETLILHGGSIMDALQIAAPKVQVLKLNLYLALRKYYNEALPTAKSIIASFTQTPSVVLMSPTTLSLYINTKFSVESLIVILDIWSRLEHLTLMFHELTPKGAFVNRLIDPTDPLCPRLISLSLDSSHYLFQMDIPEWEDLAGSMFWLRRELPLQIIQWRWKDESCRPVPWHVMKKRHT